MSEFLEKNAPMLYRLVADKPPLSRLHEHLIKEILDTLDEMVAACHPFLFEAYKANDTQLQNKIVERMSRIDDAKAKYRSFVELEHVQQKLRRAWSELCKEIDYSAALELPRTKARNSASLGNEPRDAGLPPEAESKLIDSAERMFWRTHPPHSHPATAPTTASGESRRDFSTWVTAEFVKEYLRGALLDGPNPGQLFVFDGVVHGPIQPKPWQLISHLWKCRTWTADYTTLGEVLYGDRVTSPRCGQLRGLQSELNTFFRGESLPFHIKVTEIPSEVTLEQIP